MWFFGHKSDSSNPDYLGFTHKFHREKTQKINTKPSLKQLNQGILPCTDCGIDLNLSEYTPLSIDRCPNCGTPLFIPMHISQFWLYEPLGGGGMGSVYHAFHEEDSDVDFAVKVLPRERKYDQYLIDSLMNEAQICWQLGEHQHLNRIVDYGKDGDEYYAVFDYIEGVRLDQIIDSPVKRPEKQLILWALQVLAAEQHMFDKGYLFRDLKPQNIMIDKNGNVKLFDFGLAMTLDQAENNASEQIQGSPYYIPPERIVGAGESQHSEIYSLGMVMFHVLAKQPYYSAEDIRSLVGKHVVALRLTNLRAKLPPTTSPALIAILEKMIARSPENRYITYKDLAAELFKLYKSAA